MATNAPAVTYSQLVRPEELTRSELEQLPLRCIVALGLAAARRVRHEYVVPAYVPKPGKFHSAVDRALEAAREFTGARIIDVNFAVRAGHLSDAADTAGHDIIYAHGPFAFCDHQALEHATQETRRAAKIAEAIGCLLAVVYHFSFSTLSQGCPEAVRSFGFPVDAPGWADKGLHWILEMLKACPPSRADYEALLARARGRRYPALGEAIAPDFFKDEQDRS